ncbi:hypothetical protein DU002_05550 [Corallincola holothuriorum]|uniref:Uncharacterized protein n=1 Tax=Corallincola holothuriorum TaxID=2282215 RepID=A0A368NR26_9GAMM|nr:hypothetical protein [Corallincola holothuriorum]RCU51929.1 hypothetical protein DU002_05550 [Corallincola holothuriorum]
MRQLGFGLLCLIYSSVSLAMMAPKYQVAEDLRVMTDFIAAHPKVAETLESIDYKARTIYFSDGCKAVFEVPESSVVSLLFSEPPPQLTFKSSNCELEYANKPDQPR